MKFLRSLLVVALLQAAAATSALAADDLSQIKSAGVFRVGTEGTYAPFTYHDETGKLTGFDVDIATAIAQRLGVKPQFVEGKWDGLIAGLDVNRYEAVFNEVSITDARKALIRFLDAVHHVARGADRARGQHDDPLVRRPEGQEIREHADQQFRQAGRRARRRRGARAGLQRIDRSADVRPRRCDDQRFAVVPRFPQAQARRETEDRGDRHERRGRRIRRAAAQGQPRAGGGDRQGARGHQGGRHLREDLAEVLRPRRVAAVTRG
ncbi:Extracellular solute-binding protein, family 9 [Burkholderia cenocepacia PC184]|nr:Extracellular solute-binding protein, family 9 [Burkholderia cenocepacia PC184]